MSETYEPELGQMLFGSAYGEFGCPDSVEDELYALSETLGKRNPDSQAHGFLGGEWGYGQEFANDTFSMFPYWWGDCTCGFDEAEHEWSEANPHDPECFNVRYHAESERRYAAGIKGGMTEWSKENGYPDAPYGEAVYCDCGQDALWREWATTHGHKPDCCVVRPNFKCGDVEVRWYKYIGRGMTVNREVARSEWRDIFARCEASLKEDTGKP